MIALSHALSVKHGAGFARVTAACGASSLTIAATVQAVDGVALKAMVDHWAGAAAGDRMALYSAAVAVREIEIGLDALLSLAG